MTYLLDTNIVSELRRSRPHGGVTAWLSAISPDQLFVSAVTIGELQVGVERLRTTDSEKAEEIERWLEQELAAMRVLSMDVACFRFWARLIQGKSSSVAQDAMIAATALVRGFTVVTRNTKDFLDFGVPLLDAFAPP